MKFILATKENMMEYFSPEGEVVPVTVLKAGPVTVTRIFSKEKDGYDSVQTSFKIGKREKTKEFRLKPGDKSEAKIGDTIDVSAFIPGDKLQVSSISKGKGFQGVVKRHGFHGGPRTHGQKHSEREPKGMRMAGRMGSDRITQKNLKVVLVDAPNNLMLVKGAISGRRGTLVEIVSR